MFTSDGQLYLNESLLFRPANDVLLTVNFMHMKEAFTSLKTVQVSCNTGVALYQLDKGTGKRGLLKIILSSFNPPKLFFFLESLLLHVIGAVMHVCIEVYQLFPPPRVTALSHPPL